jgi:23S rRNA (uracil1939-C5)-methyltransferase
MAWGEIFTAPVEDIAAGGAGISRYRGQVIFTDLTAPGDLVKGRIIREHRTWARGKVLEIIEPSPLRVSPPCPLFGLCGGCSLQHLSYEAQTARKSAILRDALARIGGIGDAPEPRLVPSPPYEYRNRIQLHTPEGGGSPPGFKGRGGSNIVPLGDCPVADPILRRALREGVEPPAGRNRFTLYGRGQTLLREGGGPGVSRGRVSLRGKDLLLDAAVFFQSNGTLLEGLIGDLRALAERADPSLPMADLYCGVGTFAAFLGELFPRIDLVEMNKTALDLARQNTAGPGRRYFAGSCEDWAAEEEGAAGEGGAGPYGFVVADPPRQGLSGGLRRWLVRRGPPLFAYLSCDPATLARDSRELAAGGYRLESLGYYDFYPQTAHIEALAVFSGKDHAGS